MDKLIQETFQVRVKCPKEKAFAFHADITNIAKVIPPFLNLQISYLTWPIKAGSKATIRFKLFDLIPLISWQICFTEWQEPDCFTNETKGGILKSFSHKHEFHQDDQDGISASVVKDTITYQSINSFLDQILKPFMKLLLITKLNATKSYLERKYSPKLVL